MPVGNPTALTARVGATLFVDSVNGRAVGTRGRLDKPYDTIVNAVEDASAGDTVVVLPGTYAEKDLLRNGVNIAAHPEATLSLEADGTCGIFDDTYGASPGAMTAQIDWPGPITFTYNGDGQTFKNNVVNIANANSRVFFNYGDIVVGDSLLDQGDSSAIRHRGGTLHTNGKTIWTTASGIWWSNGESFHNVDAILNASTGNNGYAIWSTPGLDTWGPNTTWTNGFLWVRMKRLAVTGINGIIQTAGTLNARVWLQIMEIVGDPTARDGAIDIQGNKVYLEVQKLTDARLVVQNIGQLWADVLKISPGLNTEAFTFAGASAKSWINVLNVEASDATAQVVNNTGGTHVMHIADGFGGNASHGINHSGGTLRFSGRMDTTAASAKSPVIVSSNGLTLEDASLVAHPSATDTITAASGTRIVTCNNVRDVNNRGIKNANVSILNSPTIKSSPDPLRVIAVRINPDDNSYANWTFNRPLNALADVSALLINGNAPIDLNSLTVDGLTLILGYAVTIAVNDAWWNADTSAISGQLDDLPLKAGSGGVLAAAAG
jgi:hypothetical protein